MPKRHNLHNYGSSRPRLTRTANDSPNSSGPLSRTNQTRTMEVRAVVLEMCTDRSLGTMS